VLLKKGSVDLQKVEDAIEKLKRDKWGGDVPLNFEVKCLMDLNKDPVTHEYMALKALNSEDNKPRVIDQHGEEIITPAPCVAGLQCMMSVSLYAYDKSGNGVSAGINGVKIMDVMGELGVLGRDRLTDEEMFGNQPERSSTVEKPKTFKKFIMTDAAREFGWEERSDVTGEWDDDELLIDNGYMTVETKYDFG